MQQNTTVNQEQQARLEALGAKLKDEAFKKQFLGIDKIEELQKFCTENGVNVTVDDLKLVIDGANEFINDQNLEAVSGGLTVEQVKNWLRNRDKKDLTIAVLGATAIYEIAAGVYYNIDPCSHDDYTIANSLVSASEKIKRLFKKKDKPGTPRLFD